MVSGRRRSAKRTQYCSQLSCTQNAMYGPPSQRIQYAGTTRRNNHLSLTPSWWNRPIHLATVRKYSTPCSTKPRGLALYSTTSSAQFSSVGIGVELAETVTTALDDGTRHSCQPLFSLRWNRWASSWRLNVRKVRSGDRFHDIVLVMGAGQSLMCSNIYRTSAHSSARSLEKSTSLPEIYKSRPASVVDLLFTVLSTYTCQRVEQSTGF